jgi:hypothetical protein
VEARAFRAKALDFFLKKPPGEKYDKVVFLINYI